MGPFQLPEDHVLLINDALPSLEINFAFGSDQADEDQSSDQNNAERTYLEMNSC